jgi:hypothetical protein
VIGEGIVRLGHQGEFLLERLEQAVVVRDQGQVEFY